MYLRNFAFSQNLMESENGRRDRSDCFDSGRREEKNMVSVRKNAYGKERLCEVSVYNTVLVTKFIHSRD